MEHLTVSQVSREFSVSTRMLRYYEQIGLIESFKKEDYSYRMYTEENIIRLKEILILRRLRIPLKQIKIILENSDAVTAIKVFEENVIELDGEIKALSSVKEILNNLILKIESSTNIQIQSLLQDSNAIMNLFDSLPINRSNLKENKAMENFKKAENNMTKLKDVRIIYLPPSFVASAHHVGDDPEYHANKLIDDFVREIKLYKHKPDLRHYGFNHPNPVDETGYHGYEVWVTIPEDITVPDTLSKKYFNGGLYAAHMIQMGNFNEWQWLFNWVEQSEKYEFAGDMEDQEHMCGLLDEHLNYINHIHLENTEPEDLQLDLLMPIRES